MNFGCYNVEGSECWKKLKLLENQFRFFHDLLIFLHERGKDNRMARHKSFAFHLIFFDTDFSNHHFLSFPTTETHFDKKRMKSNYYIKAVRHSIVKKKKKIFLLLQVSSKGEEKRFSFTTELNEKRSQMKLKSISMPMAPPFLL